MIGQNSIEENRPDNSDRDFYRRKHAVGRHKMDWAHVNIKNPFPIELNVPGFFKNVQTAFLVELEIMQKEYISFITGIYRAVQFIAFPGNVAVGTIGNIMNGRIWAKVADAKKFYLLYMEEGTGVFMKPGWSPQKMDSVIGAGRRIKREGKMIVPRGRGCAWTDPGGDVHPGADFLFLPMAKEIKPNYNKESRKDEDKSNFIFRPSTEGKPGLHELKKKNIEFLTPVRLTLLMQKVYQRALNMAGSYKKGGEYKKVTRNKFTKMIDPKAELAAIEATKKRREAFGEIGKAGY